jgi:hypothetical protein
MTSENTAHGPRSRDDRMHRRPDAIAARRYAALTPAQVTARSHGYELTADEAEFYLGSETYARTLFEMDRDVWSGYARAEDWAMNQEYRQARRAELGTFTGRMSRTLIRRALERGPLPYCPF